MYYASLQAISYWKSRKNEHMLEESDVLKAVYCNVRRQTHISFKTTPVDLD